MNEQQTVRPFLQSQITDAADYLDEARSRYSEMSSRDNPYSQHPSGSSGSIGDAVKNACKFVRQYPVEIGYDNPWKTFSRHAETLLDYLADGSLAKTDDCVPDMKRALKQMRNQAENESAL